jgi:hypothetical protein
MATAHPNSRERGETSKRPAGRWEATSNPRQTKEEKLRKNTGRIWGVKSTISLKGGERFKEVGTQAVLNPTRHHAEGWRTAFEIIEFNGYECRRQAMTNKKSVVI